MNTNNLTASIRKVISEGDTPGCSYCGMHCFAIINPFESRYKSADLKKLSDTADYMRIIPDMSDSQRKHYITPESITGPTDASGQECIIRLIMMFYFFLISTEELPEDYGTLHNYEMNARLVKNGTLFRRLTVDISKELGFPESDLRTCARILS